jgi:hypothetical protein
MDWTTMGAPPPAVTGPMRTGTVTRRWIGDWMEEGTELILTSPLLRHDFLNENLS